MRPLWVFSTNYNYLVVSIWNSRAAILQYTCINRMTECVPSEQYTLHIYADVFETCSAAKSVMFLFHTPTTFFDYFGSRWPCNHSQVTRFLKECRTKYVVLVNSTDYLSGYILLYKSKIDLLLIFWPILRNNKPMCSFSTRHWAKNFHQISMIGLYNAH